MIPCHRVVGADVSLKGYAGGLLLKKRLLAFEEEIRKPTAT
jgi:methylated-DNA-[protein]-cysteine S-methyltransferase